MVVDAVAAGTLSAVISSFFSLICLLMDAVIAGTDDDVRCGNKHCDGCRVKGDSGRCDEFDNGLL